MFNQLETCIKLIKKRFILHNLRIVSANVCICIHIDSKTKPDGMGTHFVSTPVNEYFKYLMYM